MGGARHLVARQTVEIVAAGRDEGETLSRRTSQAWATLAAAVEHGLDRADPGDRHVRVDRIELDLGPCDPARWEEALADGIRTRLATALGEALERGEALHRDVAATALALLAAFARTGRLPWWAKPQDTPGDAVAALARTGCDREAVRAILSAPDAIERLALQLGDEALIELVRLSRPELRGSAAAGLPAFIAVQAAHLAEAVSTRAVRTAVWRAILAEAAGVQPGGPETPEEPWPERTPSELRAALSSGPGRSADAALAAFCAAVAARLGTVGGSSDSTDAPREAVGSEGVRDADGRAVRRPEGDAGSRLSERLRILASRDPAAASAFRELATLVPRLSVDVVIAAEEALDRDADPYEVASVIDLFETRGLVAAREAAGLREMIAAVGAPHDSEHDALAVGNAGIVLLWPFLPQFFGGLDLLEDTDFRDDPARHRAAALLHYLAGGQATGGEQEMPLAKVLAGLALDAVHEPGEPLDERETASADALLEAVLGHAPMLGRISVAGLREAFMLRPGSLSTRDGHWLLRVERSSIDVLLDRLPWGVAWVRLPWMPDPVQVEW